MGVIDHADRNAIDEQGDIRTVVIVEPAQKVLHGLASASVLSGDQTWQIVENFLRRGVGTQLEVACANGFRRCRRGWSAFAHNHFRQTRVGFFRGCFLFWGSIWSEESGVVCSCPHAIPCQVARRRARAMPRKSGKSD